MNATGRRDDLVRGTSSFGVTGFGGDLPPNPEASTARLFDLCHPGVVLRALLFVHAVLAIGAMFGAVSAAGWAFGFATASAAALPGTLAWLAIACGAQRRLSGASAGVQWAAALALGAACGAAGASALGWIPFEAAVAPSRTASALAGAAFAAGLFLWLRMRAAAAPPAVAAARLAELQSRIRPHFLFNTLNTALALVRSDPMRAEAVLEDLAELFRVAIAETAEATTLVAELQLAERYLAIEQIRFGARLRLEWQLDPAAGAARVPPLLLQPLVENAVRHGIEPAGEGGTIRVTTRTADGRAFVTVENSVPPAGSTPGSGIALRNVRDRLRLMHDVAAAFDVRRDAETYTVRIGVPLPAATSATAMS